MGEIKISALDPAVSIIGTDIVAGVEDGTTVKIKAEDILMTQSIDAVKWKTFLVSTISSRLGGSKDPDFAKFKDDGTGSQGVFLYHFSPTIEEEVYFDMTAPTDWKEGTNIFLQFCWIPKVNGNAGEKACWGIEVVTANKGEVFGNTTLLYSSIHSPDETLIADKLYCTEIEIATTGLIVDNKDVVRAFRDATGVGGTDNYTGDAMLIGISVKYETDALGASAKESK